MPIRSTLITDLRPLDPLEDTPLRRARAACRQLVDSGVHAACAVQVAGGLHPSIMAAGEGAVGDVIDTARSLAEDVVERGRSRRVITPRRAGTVDRLSYVAASCGADDDGEIVIVVGDAQLSSNEAQVIEAWVAPAGAPAQRSSQRGACNELARRLADQHEADLVVVTLFAQAGMIVELHSRSGSLIRTHRCPVDTIWGEAARHNAGMVIGSLEMHPGAEFLAALGMNYAAIVGIENGSGLAVGAVAVASQRDLGVDVVETLLGQSAMIGPFVMQRLTAAASAAAPPGPVRGDGTVDLAAFALRVGCERLAIYQVHPAERRSGPRLVTAHARDGSMTTDPPDPHELDLVCWALERRTAITSDGCAVIVLRDDIIVYARDSARNPLECLRAALQELSRRHPDNGRRAA